MSPTKSFNSNRKYKIWMYTVSHSTLILRSEKQYFDVDYDVKYEEPNITIDIIFTGVDFISLPDNFTEINIDKKGNKFVFNNNDNWFVEAADCTVGKYEGDDADQVWNGSLKIQ